MELLRNTTGVDLEALPSGYVHRGAPDTSVGLEKKPNPSPAGPLAAGLDGAAPTAG